jgi:hypothetical protein
MSERTQAWSCGGGTQSAAIAALIVEGKLPKPDYAVMVDTEREKSSTWRYVYGTIQPRLADVGVDLIVIPKSQFASEDVFAHSGQLLIPAYTTQSGSISKLSGFCSDKWKVRVSERWLRSQGVKTSQAVTWLGFSTNELRRVRTGRFRYPLIYDYPMNREACHQLANDVLGVAPPRGGSCCWMCPNMGDRQWQEMRESDPEDFAKACAFDESIRERDPHAFVHRSGQPLIQIASEIANPGQMTLDGCDSGYCFL